MEAATSFVKLPRLRPKVSKFALTARACDARVREEGELKAVEGVGAAIGQSETEFGRVGQEILESAFEFLGWGTSKVLPNNNLTQIRLKLALNRWNFRKQRMLGRCGEICNECWRLAEILERVMFLRFLLSLAMLGSISCATASSHLGGESTCRETDIPVSVIAVDSPDIYRAPNVEGNQHKISFNSGNNTPARKEIVSVTPEYSAVVLDDGSGFQFIRDRDDSILNVRRVQRAACWTDRFGLDGGYKQNGPNEIILSDTPGRARQLLRFENYDGQGRISVVWQLPGSTEWPNERIADLIISKRPFHGFGVSPPSIEGGRRSLMTITQNEDGSLIVGSYAYAIREENLPFNLRR